MTGSTHVRVTLALVLAVSLAGCAAVDVPFLGGDDAVNSEAKNITVDAVAETQSASSYNYTMTNVVRFGQNLINMSADGRVNHTTERLYMDSVLSVQTNTTRSKEFTAVYVLDDRRCRQVDPGEPGGDENGWNVTRAENGTWNQQGLSLAAQREILNASGTTAVQLENQTVRGQDAYVVRISPGERALKRVVANRTGVDFSTVVVRNATITQYVSQADGHLLRSEMSVRYRVDGRPTRMRLTMTYSDYGDVTPIEPPTDDNGESVCAANASASVVAA